jgi:hypothetical protein
VLILLVLPVLIDTFSQRQPVITDESREDDLEADTEGG